MNQKHKPNQNQTRKQPLKKPPRLLGPAPAAARSRPTLRFTPTAWAKLLYLRDCGDTEISGFGIAAEDDLLLVQEIELLVQRCSWTHATLDDEAVADFFDRQVDAGRRPEQFARIWVHTHPGDCPRPSAVDEATFQRVFGPADWAVMFILAAGGQSYGRLRFNIGPGADVELALQIDFTQPFGPSRPEAWQAEYLACVHPAQPLLADLPARDIGGPWDQLQQQSWPEHADGKFFAIDFPSTSEGVAPAEPAPSA